MTKVTVYGAHAAINAKLRWFLTKKDALDQSADIDPDDDIFNKANDVVEVETYVGSNIHQEAWTSRALPSKE